MMTRHLLSIVIVPLLAASVATVAPRTAASSRVQRSLLEDVEIYSIDAPHTEIGFTVPWMGISKVHGSFQSFLGCIAFDSSDVTKSAIALFIRANSINTGFDRRDKDLKDKDFFDVDKFPTITFTSREVARSGDGYVLRGPLTMHGVTREIEIPFTYNGHVKDVHGDDRIGFEGHLTLKRKDYGIVGPPNFNVVLDKGIVIGETVDIPLAVEGWKATVHDTIGNPESDSLYRVIQKQGLPTAVQQFRDLRGRTADSLMANHEGMLNDVGYQFLADRRVADAIAIFKLEIETYPKNAFGYTGLGNAYAAAGDRELAVQTLEKALEINPQAPRAAVILKRLTS